MIDDTLQTAAPAAPAVAPLAKAKRDAQAAARTTGERQIRQSALEAGKARDKLYEDHPVTKNEVDVATPPLKEAYQVIQDVVVHRDPGTCLLGEFRVGKTTTINRTVQQLNETFPNLPVGIAIAKGHDKFTQGTFFSDLLEDFQHAGALRGSAAERRLRCLNMLIGQARQLSSDRYLLLVDEGQNWAEPQWTWLRDLANDLANKKVRLITVTFGQTVEMRKVRTLLLSRSRTDLVGRFLLNPQEFRGLRDVHELAETLQAYDDPGHRSYPLGTDICYSEFYMPLAWKGGWRLADEADRMWDEFRRVAQRSGRVAGNIGMNWIGGAIRNYLFSESLNDVPGYASTPDVWAMAVRASGYESTLF